MANRGSLDTTATGAQRRLRVRHIFSILGVAALLAASMSPAAAEETDPPEPLGLAIGYDQPLLDLKTGSVTVTGSLNCSESVEVPVSIEVSQNSGPKRTVVGHGETTVQCIENVSGEDLTPYAVTVVADDGRFRPGPTQVSGFATACLPAQGSQGCAKYGEASFQTPQFELRPHNR
jgi:hypothetical protein